MSPQHFDQWLALPASARPPLVMGVLNVTPDSFSDGGRFSKADEALRAAELMAADGADLIDVGGESTRPGSLPVAPDEQIARVVPVIAAVRRRLDLAVSIDTTRAAVAEAALDAGATLVNDISAGRDDPDMLPLVAARGAAVILMHMQGTPATMQIDPRYADVTSEVLEFLRERLGAAVAAGVDRRRVLLDPGIGFGKTLEHNLELLRRTSDLAAIGQPLVIGTSRKGFIGKAIGEPDPLRRTYGTAATVTWAIANGAAVVRVHEVGAMAQVVRMTRAIMATAPVALPDC